MPFASQQQRRWMFSQKPRMARKWEKHTPKGKLPKKASRRKRQRGKA